MLMWAFLGMRLQINLPERVQLNTVDVMKNVKGLKIKQKKKKLTILATIVTKMIHIGCAVYHKKFMIKCFSLKYKK